MQVLEVVQQAMILPICRTNVATHGATSGTSPSHPRTLPTIPPHSTEPWNNFWNISDLETSSIEGAEVDDADAATVIYDLSGRRAANPTKGIYIVNGKKVVFK